MFWADAVATVAYLKNCTPTKSGGNKTPLERWNGKIPNISHLRIFGCVAYMYNPKEKRSKLDDRAKKGIFVGYSAKRVAYRIFDPETQGITEARTVKFNEEKGGKLLKTSTSLKLRFFDETLLDEILGNPNNQEEEQLTHDEFENENNLNEEECDMLEQHERQPVRKTKNTREINRNIHLVKEREREERLLAQGLRRSERIKGKHQANLCSEEVPQSYQEAVNSSNYDEWKEAMREEIQALKDQQVWTLTPRTKEMKILKSKWVFSKKNNPDGTIDRLKARLVVAGHNQREGMDYQEAFTPVIRMESLRILLATASHRQWKMRLYDVKNAYLHGSLLETVYMEQPEGWEEGESEMVCKLDKSLYGLPQSGHCWNKRLNEILTEIGMESLTCEPCIYVKRRNNSIVVIGVYVDDLIILGNDDKFTDEIVDQINQQVELRDVTNQDLFLGIEIKNTEHGIELSQTKYISDILCKFGLEESKPVTTPGNTSQDLNNFENSPEVNKQLYQEMMGSLMYLMVGTRPDIAFNVCQLSQFSNDPRMIHMVALKRIFRYLNGTRNYKLVFVGKEEQILISTDASWCTAVDGKSFSGYGVKIGNSLVGWKSKKQRLVALSTCEAELLAICEGVLELKWIVRLVTELTPEQDLKLPITVLTDSKAAQDWISSAKFSNRTKHINRKFHFVREEVKRGNIVIRHVRSEEQEADIFTKALSAVKHHRCRLDLGVVTED